MTGGARPLLIWALLLTTTGTLNAIWTGDLIQIATFAAAVCAILILITYLTIANPAAIRGGEPVARAREIVVSGSFAAFVTAIGFGMFMFGFAFGHFIIYFGAALMLAGIGRLIGEWRAQDHAEAGR